MAALPPVELLRRQYLQSIDPERLTLPSMEHLRLPEVQDQIFHGMFDESRTTYMPPYRYRFRVLKRLVNALEEAIEDPEEDEISNDISGSLAQYVVQPLPSASEAAKQKSYITYTAPLTDLRAPQITLLEAPSLLASSGTTGFRTWEAALFLGTYLCSPNGGQIIAGQNLIELGAGTGFLSILCAKHLNARHVLATDGSREIITNLKTNIDLNALTEGEIVRTSVLQWGHALINGVLDCRDSNMVYDLAIGADVTYDVESIPSLIATLLDLFELYPTIQVVISATVRNAETLDVFIQICSKNSFVVKKLDVSTPGKQKQNGFFIPTATPIEILLITREGPTKDPYEF